MNNEKKLILFIEEFNKNEKRIQKLSEKHNTNFLKQKKIEFRPQVRYENIKLTIDSLFFILSVVILFLVDSVFSEYLGSTLFFIFIFILWSLTISRLIDKFISCNFFNIQTKLSYIELKIFKEERKLLFKRKAEFNKDKKEICCLVKQIEIDYFAISRELKKVNTDIFVEEYINAFHSDEILDTDLKITSIIADQFPLLFQEQMIKKIRKKNKEKNCLNY